MCLYPALHNDLRFPGTAGRRLALAQNGINQDPAEFIPPLVMDPSDSSRLYFGTDNLYQTLNGASSWTPISAFSGGSYELISCIAVAPSDPNTLYAGTDGGLVFNTQNVLTGSGAVWAQTEPFNAGSVNQIAVDPRDALVAWAGGTSTINSDGPIYYTTDGFVTATQAGHGVPSLPVNDILVDPDIANTVYVANDIGVYRTVDNGVSWFPLGTSLPNVIVHSLRLDRPSRTLRAATYGRGVWDIPVPDTGQAAITITSSLAGAPFSLEDGTVL